MYFLGLRSFLFFGAIFLSVGSIAENHGQGLQDTYDTRKVALRPVLKEERSGITYVTSTQKTSTGAEFKRASEENLRAAGVKDPKKFGEAWEDPSGMIWSDVAKNKDGYALYTDYEGAVAYCESLGAKLPSGYDERENGKNGFPKLDSDFVRFRKYMGAESQLGWYTKPTGYTPQVLPNLKYATWSSSLKHMEPPISYNVAYTFDGLSGSVGWEVTNNGAPVRCVVSAARVDR